ncbi:unnamed protein product, partial [Polarella glacialis]
MYTFQPTPTMANAAVLVQLILEAPMLKVACMLAEEHCNAVGGGLEIVGLYHATASGNLEMTSVK